MYKNLFIFCFLVFIKSYSQTQEDIDFCREFNKKSLKEIYRSDKTFKCYLKEEDFHLEVNIKLDSTNAKYQNPAVLNSLKERSKEDVYSKIAVMNEAGLFNNQDELPCDFSKYQFHYIYMTSDYIKIAYNYYIIPDLLFSIHENLDKRKLFRILVQY